MLAGIWPVAGEFLDPAKGCRVIPASIWERTAGAAMIRVFFSLVLGCAIAATSTTAMPRSRYYGTPWFHTYFGNLSNVPNSLYNPARDPNAVYSGGTYAGSDPDPNIRAALIREFGRRR
jgi:hypothetical protein